MKYLIKVEKVVYPLLALQVLVIMLMGALDGGYQLGLEAQKKYNIELLASKLPRHALGTDSVSSPIPTPKRKPVP